MIEQKWKLSNGNTLIWLGNQPIHGCENVLVLGGGDIVFLKEESRLNGSQVKNDIKALDKAAFFNKYKWPNNSSSDDLYTHLK
jgi:hypothetical protein